MRQLNPADTRPPYLDVADALREAIHGGEFPPGSRLPGRDTLARHFAVAPMTVTRALHLLRDESLVSSRQGQGTTVRELPAPPRDLAAELDALSARVADLEARLRD